MVFRTGNCLIVGNCTKEILTFVYEYIRGILMAEYETIRAKHDTPLAKTKKQTAKKIGLFYEKLLREFIKYRKKDLKYRGEKIVL